MFPGLKGEEVCMYCWGEKCRARKTARRDESSLEGHKTDQNTAVILKNMHGTELGKNLEKSPSPVFLVLNVTFSEI